MSTEEAKVKILVEDNDIVIRCSIDDLIFIAESDPEEGYKVINKDKFAQQFVHELQNSTAFSNAEGMNRVEELFKNGYNSVYENADEDTMINKCWNCKGVGCSECFGTGNDI